MSPQHRGCQHSIDGPSSCWTCQGLCRPSTCLQQQQTKAVTAWPLAYIQGHGPPLTPARNPAKSGHNAEPAFCHTQHGIMNRSCLLQGLTGISKLCSLCCFSLHPTYTPRYTALEPLTATHRLPTVPAGPGPSASAAMLPSTPPMRALYCANCLVCSGPASPTASSSDCWAARLAES